MPQRIFHAPECRFHLVEPILAGDEGAVVFSSRTEK